MTLAKINPGSFIRAIVPAAAAILAAYFAPEHAEAIAGAAGALALAIVSGVKGEQAREKRAAAAAAEAFKAGKKLGVKEGVESMAPPALAAEESATTEGEG